MRIISRIISIVSVALLTLSSTSISAKTPSFPLSFRFKQIEAWTFLDGEETSMVEGEIALKNGVLKCNCGECVSCLLSNSILSILFDSKDDKTSTINTLLVRPKLKSKLIRGKRGQISIKIPSEKVRELILRGETVEFSLEKHDWEAAPLDPEHVYIDGGWPAFQLRVPWELKSRASEDMKVRVDIRIKYTDPCFRRVSEFRESKRDITYNKEIPKGTPPGQDALSQIVLFPFHDRAEISVRAALFVGGKALQRKSYHFEWSDCAP